ncbi:MAG: alpha/beta hydrolase [Allosphingosinicella sp.]
MSRIGALRWIAALACALSPPATAKADPSPHTLARGDGSEIAYYLDRVDPAARQGLLLMLQGSGCEPVIDREWFRSEPALLAPGRAVLAIEKYGVTPARPQLDLEEGCTADYWRANTLQQRVLDAVRVLAQLRSETWWNGELIIYGGSEGGAIAAMLAPLVPETDAVVIQSSGIGVPVGELIRSAVPPPVALEMARVFAEARANPTGALRFGGASYRWWAEAVDVTPAISLLQTGAPILLIQGFRDQSAPVVTARATRDLFARSGRHNLTYVEYPDYDHAMIDSAGRNHRSEVLAAAQAWLAENSRPR